MDRRSFLRGFVAGVAGLAVPKYFDMGAAWQKHGWLYLGDVPPAGKLYISPVDVYVYGPHELHYMIF